jgi:hypothetical protein
VELTTASLGDEERLLCARKALEEARGATPAALAVRHYRMAHTFGLTTPKKITQNTTEFLKESFYSLSSLFRFLSFPN